MKIITVLAAPARADLSQARLDAVRRRLDGGPATWLAPAMAAEFPVEERPRGFEALWREQQDAGFDLALSAATRRRKRLLIADMDSTMIEQECVDELAAIAGVAEPVRAITARAMNGEIGFEPALVERVALLAGLPQSAIAKVLDQRITLAPGGYELVATMRAQGAYTALISGGFTAFTGPIAAMLGFDEHRGNTLLVADGRLTGAVATPILGRDAKLHTLHEMAVERGLSPADTVAVGDGANDLPMLLAAGLGVALHAKPVVAEAAPVRLHHADLAGLLYLQGYHRDEISAGPPLPGRG